MQMFTDVPVVYLYRDPVDFRKAINGLAAIVEQDMNLSPFSDALFVFSNKGRDKIKVLYWDNTGFCLWQKRLEKAHFQWPRHIASPIMELSENTWKSLLLGFTIVGHSSLELSAC